MISYATVSEMKRNIEDQCLWADWKYNTRCWEYGWVLRYGRFAPGVKCLDAGCGQSPLLFELSGRGCEAHGLDYLQQERSDAPTTYGIPAEWIRRHKRQVEYHHGSMFSAPFPDETFDRVTCLSVLEHIFSRDEPRKHEPCLKELRRILKPGGLLIVTVDYMMSIEAMPYDYRDDLDFLKMELLEPNSRLYSRDELFSDEDAYFVPPDAYLSMGYGQGFNVRLYHRLTSVGYILKKPVHEPRP